MKFLFLSLVFALCASLGLHGEESMPVERQQTLSIIKPDAVAANHIGAIFSRFEKAGLRIVAMRMVKLSNAEAREFYAVHKDRPFYADLAEFMSSGPIVAMVLEGNNAIAKNREIMGATDPKKAAAGTIRADFAESMSKNAVHGSDSPESAKTEIAFFFSKDQIFSR
jgi:nucleoside-diphosphate kinase